MDQFYNGIGTIGDVSSARVIGSGCVVVFKDNAGITLCNLSSGEHNAESFINTCGNGVVTQYSIQSAGTIYSIGI